MIVCFSVSYLKESCCILRAQPLTILDCGHTCCGSACTFATSRGPDTRTARRSFKRAREEQGLQLPAPGHCNTQDPIPLLEHSAAPMQRTGSEIPPVTSPTLPQAGNRKQQSRQPVLCASLRFTPPPKTKPSSTPFTKLPQLCQLAWGQL